MLARKQTIHNDRGTHPVPLTIVLCPECKALLADLLDNYWRNHRPSPGGESVDHPIYLAPSGSGLLEGDAYRPKGK